MRDVAALTWDSTCSVLQIKITMLSLLIKQYGGFHWLAFKSNAKRVLLWLHC